MNSKILILLPGLIIGTLYFADVSAQVGTGDSPFERKTFGDVKFLDAYFGTSHEKMEVTPGDSNVPFTVVLANVGTQDITGIRGQLSLPYGFSASDSGKNLIFADADSNAVAGEIFTLTFFVNVEEQNRIQQYPGTVKVDYSRLRESGLRTGFFEFDFKVTGHSIINMRAINPFLISLTNNNVVIEISNDGTAPVSGVDIVLQNTQGTISSTSQSVTNVENVVILDSNWEIGQINPGQSKYLELDVYVPDTLKGASLRAPMDITYFNSHGDSKTISRIVDFYVKGLIDASIYDVDVIDLSGKQTVIGEIINEGNEDALFGFVSLEPLGDSNIKSKTQYIDEIEIDSPVPFNIPIEFEGEPKYGEHDIRLTVRYKDSTRDEKFVTYETTITLEEKLTEENNQMDYMQFLAIPIVGIVGYVAYSKLKKRKEPE